MIIFRYCEQWKMPVIIRDQCSSHSDNRVCSEIMNFIFKNKKSALFPSCLSDYTLITIQVLFLQNLQSLWNYKICSNDFKNFEDLDDKIIWTAPTTNDRDATFLFTHFNEIFVNHSPSPTCALISENGDKMVKIRMLW